MAFDPSLLDEIEQSEKDSQPEVSMETLTAKAEELARTLDQIDSAERELKELKKRKNDIEMRELPDLMNRARTDRIGVPSRDYDLALSPYYKANISAEWEEERRERAFAHLREIGGEDLIRSTLTLSAGAGSVESVEQIAQRLRQMLAEYDLEASIQVGMSVPWNSLTSFIRHHVEAGGAVDKELLGATIGETVKVKKRT